MSQFSAYRYHIRVRQTVRDGYSESQLYKYLQFYMYVLMRLMVLAHHTSARILGHRQILVQAQALVWLTTSSNRALHWQFASRAHTCQISLNLLFFNEFMISMTFRNCHWCKIQVTICQIKSLHSSSSLVHCIGMFLKFRRSKLLAHSITPRRCIGSCSTSRTDIASVKKKRNKLYS